MEAFAGSGSITPDSVLLERLLQHRSPCEGDAAYVDQVRRLMLAQQRVNEARALVVTAERQRVFTPDENRAEHAWIDLGEAEIALANGDEPRAQTLHARATSAAEELRRRWPEWSLPYRVLSDAALASPTGSTANVGPAHFAQLEREAQGRLRTGAIVRASTGPQVAAFAFVLTLVAMLGLAGCFRAWGAIRAMTRLAATSIASSPPGYMALTGTLHLPPTADAVIGPLTHEAGVWYAADTSSDSKGAVTVRQRSAQPFVLRDASGEALIDPRGMTVRTRHSVTKLRGASGLTSRTRRSEQLLKEGDSAYVLGELAVEPSSSGASVLHVRLAEDGRRLLVSNYTRDELIRRERFWLWSGAIVFALSTAVLVWSNVQRFHVVGIPGTLR